MSYTSLPEHAHSQNISTQSTNNSYFTRCLPYYNLYSPRKPHASLLISFYIALLAATWSILLIQASAAFAASPNALNQAVDSAKMQQADDLSIGSTIFLDVNNNGLLDDGETGIEGISLSLYNTVNTLVATATTDIDGSYYITGLVQGNYYIIIQNPPENAPTSSSISNLNDDQVDDDDNGDQPGGPGAPIISPIIQLAAGQEPTDESGPHGDQDAVADNNGDMTIDFGFVPTTFDVSIGDFVWDDQNQNGLQDEDEIGIPDVTVNIFNTNKGLAVVDEDGNPRSETTDDAGQFLFTNLPPGNYYLTFSDIPVGYETTLQNEGSNDSLDSDVYPNVVQTVPTGPLVDGVQYTSLDAGFFDSEAGLVADISAAVWYDYDGDGIQGSEPNEYGLADVAVTLYESANRSIVQSTVTDEDGNYIFRRVPAGNYYIVFTPPNDFVVPTWPRQSSDETVDSDIDTTGSTAQFVLVGGEDISTLDAGFAPSAELEMNFWNDENQNGIRDASEPGFNGAQIILFMPGGERMSDVLTDSNGIGRFKIPPGSYRLQFVPPGGFDISQPSTEGAINSDADQNGLTSVFSLLPNETITDWGAGAFESLPSSLDEEEEPEQTENIIGENGGLRRLLWLYLPLIE